MTNSIKNSRRGDYSEQLRNLTSAFEGSTINPALPYTPQIVQALRNSIVNLKLLPGTPISEAAIAEVLGLSRTPVREALKDLSMESFVEIFPQAGTVVSPIRISLIEQGSFIRRALESANLMDLVGMMSDAAENKVQKVLDQQARALEADDTDAFFLHDEAMHRIFFELTDRLPIWSIVLNSRRHIDRARLLLVREEKTIPNAYEEHLKIAKALFEKDKKKLGAAINFHIKTVSTGLQHYVDRTHSAWIVN